MFITRILVVLSFNTKNTKEDEDHEDEQTMNLCSSSAFVRFV
jgi:hypothetical protein